MINELLMKLMNAPMLGAFIKNITETFSHFLIIMKKPDFDWAWGCHVIFILLVGDFQNDFFIIRILEYLGSYTYKDIFFFFRYLIYF